MNPVQIEKSVRANLERNKKTLAELKEILGPEAYASMVKKLPKELQGVCP